MKRIISCLLSILLLIATVSLITSCGVDTSSLGASMSTSVEEEVSEPELDETIVDAEIRRLPKL